MHVELFPFPVGKATKRFSAAQRKESPTSRLGSLPSSPRIELSWPELDSHEGLQLRQTQQRRAKECSQSLSGTRSHDLSGSNSSIF
jgi:hypothetical protein